MADHKHQARTVFGCYFETGSQKEILIRDSVRQHLSQLPGYSRLRFLLPPLFILGTGFLASLANLASCKQIITKAS